MRIVAFDIETTELEADRGRVLCASFLPITSNDLSEVGKVKTIVKPIRRKDPLDDSGLVKLIRDELKKANCIVTWNGKLFDIPFLKARLLVNGLETIDPQMHLDCMWYAAGNSAKLRSRRLDSVAKYFKVANQKTELVVDTWQAARTGDPASLKLIVEHCEADVKVLADVYWKLLPGIRNIHRGG